MSNSVTEENDQLTLLDVLGFPSDQMLFNPLSKNLIYSLGSNVISYNFTTNSKTFVQYLPTEIKLLKFLDNSQNFLLTIDNSPSPLLCIWELPSFTQIYSTEIIIPSQNTFSMSNIFFEKLYEELFLIVITSSIGINYLFILKNENEVNNNYNLELFGKLSYIKETIYGFKVFYNSKDIIFLLEKNLLYYNLDLDKEICSEKIKIDFPFGIMQNTLIINKDINIIAFLTAKGNCLIYDQNGNNKPSINPFGQEYFTSCQFEGDSLCLGTNNGKIYVYNIYDNKPKFFIHYKAILRIKNNFQLNSKNDLTNNNKYDDNNDNSAGPAIKYIFLDEKMDIVFLRLEDNSILFSPLNILIDDLYYQNNDKSKNNNFIFYAFNHSKNIDDIIINNSNLQNNNNSYILNDFDNNSNNENNNNDLVVFSCSKDQKMIKYYIDYELNKLSNSFFNLKPILNNSQSQGRIMNNNNNKLGNKNISENMVYLTVLKYHPIYNNKLFAGDNKGFLYLFDTKENKFQYKKPIFGTYEIVFLEFSPDAQLLCIGFDTGCQIFCDMKKDCEVCLELNSHYMPVEESEFRKMNNQIICFTYFFKNNKKHEDCFLYTKNNYLLEYSKLIYDRNKLNKKELKKIKIINQILDIKIHTSENYAIILNNTNQIIITKILSGEITAVIDLNSRVKTANNIQIDNSGLFLGVICELFNYDENRNINLNKYIYTNDNSCVDKLKRNYIIIFEIGTGRVKTCINYINPISKILFDNEGNYLIIAGKKGEISLWKLSEMMTNNIKYVLEEMKINKDFWEEYEIKYDNNFEYKDEIVNNSDYVINNRTNKNTSTDNIQIKHDIKFNSRGYNRQDIIKNNNMTNSNVTTSNYFRRTKNRNESERNSEYYDKQYYNTDNLANNRKNKNENIFISQNEEFNDNNFKNMTSVGDKPYKYNNFRNYDSNKAKRAPLLIDSKELLKERNYNDNNELINNKNEEFTDFDKDKETFVNYKYETTNNKEKNNFNEYDDRYKNDRLIKKNNNNISRNENYSNDNIRKLNNNYNNDNNENNDNKNNNKNYNNNDNYNKNYNKNDNKKHNNYEDSFNINNNSFNKAKIIGDINNNINNNYNKNNDINGMDYNNKYKNDYQNMNMNTIQKSINNNIMNTSKTNSKMNYSKSQKYFTLNTYSQRAPKLKHINLVSNINQENNRFKRAFTNRNNNLLFSKDNILFASIEKNDELRQKNIKNAINKLLENNTPRTDLEKEKNIQLTFDTQKEPRINIPKNIFNYNNKNNNIENENNINNKYQNNIKNKEQNNISEDFIVINNKKIYLNKYKDYINNRNNRNLISFEIRNKFGMSKKYPEPDDIDDNLINSLVEPIPDLEQHNKIQKINMDEINKFEEKNKKNKKKTDLNKQNDKNIHSQKDIKNNDEKNIKQSKNNDDIYIKKNVVDNDLDIFKSSDEEFNEKDF